MKTTRTALWFALLAAIGCNAGDDRDHDEPRIPTEKAPSPANSHPDRQWFPATTSFSPTTDSPSEDDRVEIEIAPDGRFALGGHVGATLEDIDRRLQERNAGDLFQDGFLVSRPGVIVDVTPETPWHRVLSIMLLCEQWHHRRVCVRTQKRGLTFHLPRNVSDLPPVPDGACVPIALWPAQKPSTAKVRFDSRWADLGSFRTRIGNIEKHVGQLPAVAVLDIRRDVHFDDVADFFEILSEANIRRFIYMLPRPPR